MKLLYAKEESLVEKILNYEVENESVVYLGPHPGNLTLLVNFGNYLLFSNSYFFYFIFLYKCIG